MKNYLGREIPKLGFGLMRLPMIGEEIDIEQVKKMTDLFLEHGYTYFDTAFGYANGKSEAAAKEALVDRYPRERFQLATKMPAWAVSTAQEAKDMFWTSLERTGAGYFDFYLLHNLGGERTPYFDEYGIWDFLTEQKEKGLIRHLGFSIHDKAQALDEVLTAHPEAEFVQLQINYADWNEPMIESRKCLEVAHKHKKPVVIMEPVKGGNLANPPKKVADLLEEAAPGASYASWGIRFAASLDGIITVLSGMSNLGQMEDNLSTMDRFTPLGPEEMGVIEKAQEILEELPNIPCTYCRYCVKDCPAGIDIPFVFKAMNAYLVYDNMAGAKMDYHWATFGGAKATDCIACGQCESVCPQHIAIIEELKKTAAVLEQ